MSTDIAHKDMQLFFDYMDTEVKVRLDELSRKMSEIMAAAEKPVVHTEMVASKGPMPFRSTWRQDVERTYADGKLDCDAIDILEEAPVASHTENDRTCEHSETASRSAQDVQEVQEVQEAQDVQISGRSHNKGRTQVVLVRGMSSDAFEMNDAQAAYISGKRRSLMLDGVWQVLENTDSRPVAMIYEKLMNALIVVSIFSALVQARDHPGLGRTGLLAFEGLVDVLFVLEIFIRFVACPNHLKFFVSAFNIIDIFAGLPPLVLRLYFGFQVPPCDANRTFACLALNGIVPVLRLFRLLRRFQQIHLLLAAFKASLEAMPTLIYMYLCIMMGFAGMLYMVEPKSNVDSFSVAWWLALVSMTTVGYGDVTPATPAGQVVVGVFVFTTALYMAVPLGIIGNAFNDVWKDRDKILLVQRLRQRMEQSGYTSADIPILFDLFDDNNDGMLDLREFRRMISSMRLGLAKDRVTELFYAFDGNGSGNIDVVEFMRALFPGGYRELVEEWRLGQTSVDTLGRFSKVDEPPQQQRVASPQPSARPYQVAALASKVSGDSTQSRQDERAVRLRRSLGLEGERLGTDDC